MSMQDPLSDMLTRLRNAQMAGKQTVDMPGSKLKVSVAKVLEQEGYIAGHSYDDSTGKPRLQIDLKYYDGKPVIAEIHGFAFGVGLDVAMACDFRIAADDARLQDQRVIDRGMHAVTGCAWFQPRALGLTRAMEFLILGEPMSGAEAATCGMVTRSVPGDELTGAVAAIAERLAAAPTKAIGLMKRQILEGQHMTHAEFMNFAAPLIHEIEIKDRAEGIAAFLEKRPPRFTGE